MTTRISCRRARGETVASAALAALTIGVLAWQQLASPITDHDGERIPVIAPDLWAFWMPLLIAAIVSASVVGVLPRCHDEPSRAVLATSIALDLLGAAIVLCLTVTGRLINPDLLDRHPWLDDPYGPVIDLAVVLGVASAVATVLVRAVRRAKGWA